MKWIAVFVCVIMNHLSKSIIESKFSKKVAALKPVILQEPSDYRIVMNSTILLTCRVKVVLASDMKLYWIKGDFAIGSTEAEIRDFNSRYQLVHGKNSSYLYNGIFDLRIVQISFFDNDKFRCQIAIRHSPPARSREAYVYVLVASNKPVLLQLQPVMVANSLNSENHAWTEHNKELQLLCAARYGRPGARLDWLFEGLRIHADVSGNFILPGVTLIGHITNEKKSEKHNDLLSHSISVLRLNISKQHHRKKIACEAFNEGYEEAKDKMVIATLIEYRSKPRVNISVEPKQSRNEYHENQYVMIRCYADGTPDSFYWQWSVTKNNVTHILPNVAEPYYHVKLTRNLNSALFRCTAMNFAEGHADVVISVLYAPSFESPEPDILAADEMSTVSLKCDPDSNPKSTITWHKQASATVLSHSQVHVIPQTFGSDYGCYMCIVTNSIFPPVSKYFYIEHKSVPKVFMSPVVYSHKMASYVDLECAVECAPRVNSSQIFWFKDGVKFRTTSRLILTVISRQKQVISTLRIYEFKESDAGLYNCSAFNDLGMSFNFTYLILKDEIPMGAVVGASVTISLLLTVIIIIIIFCKRRVKEKQIIEDAVTTNTTNPTEHPRPCCMECGDVDKVTPTKLVTTLVSTSKNGVNNKNHNDPGVLLRRFWSNNNDHNFPLSNLDDCTTHTSTDYSAHYDHYPHNCTETWRKSDATSQIMINSTSSGHQYLCNNRSEDVPQLSSSTQCNTGLHLESTRLHVGDQQQPLTNNVLPQCHHTALLDDKLFRCEESDTYKEDSNKSYDSGFSPGLTALTSCNATSKGTSVLHSVPVVTNIAYQKVLGTAVWNTQI